MSKREQPVFDAKNLDSLDEICSWLSTFRQRQSRYRSRDQSSVSKTISDLESRYRERRAELA